MLTGMRTRAGQQRILTGMRTRAGPQRILTGMRARAGQRRILTGMCARAEPQEMLLLNMSPVDVFMARVCARGAQTTGAGFCKGTLVCAITRTLSCADAVCGGTNVFALWLL